MLKIILARLILTADERILLVNLRKLERGEQKFFQRAIKAMACRTAGQS
ncbi:hypothetical protein QYS36_20280 [Pseudomonas sp. G34]|nr:hypothetical protein [Pseudomonas sp. G34]MDQ7987285.1 hypothetical protein [Pseudomonas sp. G34]